VDLDMFGNGVETEGGKGEQSRRRQSIE